MSYDDFVDTSDIKTIVDFILTSQGFDLDSTRYVKELRENLIINYRTLKLLQKDDVMRLKLPALLKKELISVIYNYSESLKVMNINDVRSKLKESWNFVIHNNFNKFVDDVYDLYSVLDNKGSKIKNAKLDTKIGFILDIVKLIYCYIELKECNNLMLRTAIDGLNDDFIINFNLFAFSFADVINKIYSGVKNEWFRLIKKIGYDLNKQQETLKFGIQYSGIILRKKHKKAKIYVYYNKVIINKNVYLINEIQGIEFKNVVNIQFKNDTKITIKTNDDNGIYNLIKKLVYA